MGIPGTGFDSLVSLGTSVSCPRSPTKGRCFSRYGNFVVSFLRFLSLESSGVAEAQDPCVAPEVSAFARSRQPTSSRPGEPCGIRTPYADHETGKLSAKSARLNLADGVWRFRRDNSIDTVERIGTLNSMGARNVSITVQPPNARHGRGQRGGGGRLS